MSFVLVLGGGNIPSGVALRLHRSGFPGDDQRAMASGEQKFFTAMALTVFENESFISLISCHAASFS